MFVFIMKTIKSRILIVLILFQSLINLSFLNIDDFFSIIILPDTQHYTSSYPEMIHKQMD